MPDLEPKHKHPLDVWWSKAKWKLAPILFVTGPLSLAFIAYLLSQTFDMTHPIIWLGGTFCLITLIIAFAELMDD